MERKTVVGSILKQAYIDFLAYGFVILVGLAIGFKVGELICNKLR